MDEKTDDENDQEFAHAVFQHLNQTGAQGPFGHHKDCPCPLCCYVAKINREMSDV